MARLGGHGLLLDLPDGWDGRISRRATAPPEARALPVSAAPPPPPAVGHAATFSLPRQVGDFGSGAVERMGSGDLFLSIVEFDPDSLGSALFAHRGVPRRLRPGDFDPQALQRTLPGQAGTQVFFTESDRPFCLYVVLGGFSRRVGTVPIVNDVLAGVQVT